MNLNKKYLAIFLLGVSVVSLCAKSLNTQIKNLKSHPRLFPWQLVGEKMQTPLGQIYIEALKRDADKVTQTEPLVYEEPGVKTGFRLLDHSRKVLSRVETLVGAYYVFNDKKYADRAIAEMINAAQYPNWNPRHYLDTAEMSFALSLGYDALYDVISEDDKKIISDAVYQKGLLTSLDSSISGWMRRLNNWNQVCHTGLIAGAVVFAEKDFAVSQFVIQRGLDDLFQVMRKTYPPIGCYPEGPGYWMYGTKYNSYIMAILNNAFDDCFGLDKIAGFGESTLFVNATLFGNGNFYRYSDCFGNYHVNFAKIFLADFYKKPNYLCPIDYKQLKSLKSRPESMSLLYYPEEVINSDANNYYYTGTNESEVPIVVYRNGFDYNDAFLGIKAGDVDATHAHQDQGSFCYSKNSVVWAEDIGPEGYAKIEAAGVNFSDMSYNSRRWTLFRIGPRSHNIVMLNNENFNTDGRGDLIFTDEAKTVVDLTTIYPKLHKSHTRTFEWDKNSGNFSVTDEFIDLELNTDVRWQMFTRANIQINGNVAILTKQDKKIKLTLTGSQDLEWSFCEADTLLKPFESKNKYGKMLEIKTNSQNNKNLTINVKFEE